MHTLYISALVVDLDLHLKIIHDVWFVWYVQLCELSTVHHIFLKW